MKRHEISVFVNALRQYAKVRKLGKPTIIVNNEPFSFPRGFCLVWPDHKRAFKVGQGWNAEEFDYLIERLRRW